MVKICGIGRCGMRPGYAEHKILIWGKTYPELSKKYIETVCTAGVLESGKPVRLYPITYRYLNDEQFKLYQWITAGLLKNPNDPRPESYKIDCDSITLGETLPATGDEWGKRGEFMFKDKGWQFESVDDLQAAQKRDRTSIGIVTPRAITKVEAADRSEEDAQSFEEKFEDLKKTVEAQRSQIQMFEDAIPPEMKKLEFLKSRVMVSWLCHAKACSGHRMQVLDWGLCELQRREGSEAAVKRMAEICRLETYDLRFFLGNLFQYPTSFLIVGMWYPKRRTDMFRW
jgi:hypothetical protein